MDDPRRDQPPFRVIVHGPKESSTLVATADAQQDVQGTSPNNASTPASSSSSRSDAARPPPFASRRNYRRHWHQRGGTDIEYNTVYRRSFLIWAIHNCIVVRSNAIVARWVAKNIEGIWNLMPPLYPGLYDNCQVVCLPIYKVAEIAAHHGNNISATNSSINGSANGSTNSTNVTLNYFYATDREELIVLAWRYHQSPAGVWFDAQGQLIRSDLND